MNIRTLGRYLIGRPDAIDAVARDPHSLGLGLFFVLLAGVAREYDQEHFVENPWPYFLPLVASIGLGLLYYIWLRWRYLGPSRHSARVFFSLFWFTAPLAFLYAIPYEIVLDPIPAVWCNTATLLLVATWRITLFSRALAQVTGVRALHLAAEQLWFGSLAVLIPAVWAKLTVVHFMGGVIHSPAEIHLHLLRDFAFWTAVLFAGTLWIPVLRHRPHRPKPVLELPCQITGQSMVPWLAAGLLLAGGLMAWMQPKFRFMNDLNALLDGEAYPEIVRRLEVSRRSDFPSHLELPGLYRAEPWVLLVTEPFTDRMPQWVCRSYALSVRWLFGGYLSYLPDVDGQPENGPSRYDQPLAATWVWLKSQPGWSEWLADDDMKYMMRLLRRTFLDVSEAYPMTNAFLAGLKPRIEVDL